MANNFGLGSRSMKKAGEFALKNAALSGQISYSTKASVGQRWECFIDSLMTNRSDIRNLEGITFDTTVDYGKELALMVDEEDMAASTAQNYVSAVNTVMDIASRGKWKSVSPTVDCGIPKRSFVRTCVPASLNRDHYENGLERIRAELGERAILIIELCRECGLRSKEASLFNPQTASSEIEISRLITISDGTKGGRARTLSLITEKQIDVIKRAAIIQANDKSMIPSHRSWREWRDCELRQIRAAVQEKLGATGLHDLRAGYACQRYQEITGFHTPLLGGTKPGKKIDREARLQIAQELGHGRVEISNAYIGGQK